MGPVFAGACARNIIRSFRRKHSAHFQEVVDVIPGSSLKKVSPSGYQNRHQHYEDGRIIPMTNLEVSSTVDDSPQSMYLGFEAGDSV